MLSQEMLLEYTESYLKSLVAETSVSLGTNFDSAAPFGELGIDSFRVLKIIKALEADFGTLPKTLLFENFNVDALANYFVDEHTDTLRDKFSKGQAKRAASPAKAAGMPEKARSGSAPGFPSATPNPKPKKFLQAPVPVQAWARPAAQASAPAPAALPVRVLETDLPAYPALAAVVADLFERYKNEGCVSRGTRNIAPNLFIGSARKGYFNYSRSNRIILVYAFTGPEDYFAELAAEMQRYCVEKKFQLNIFGDAPIPAIDGVAFSSTPFGALQRVLDIGSFSLEGGAMRRLRYQVAKFDKAGACRTTEYACGTDHAVDREIAAVIDRWCAAKTMVNPLIHIVREEILAGTLHAQHRIFLTYLDDKLQNVILISAMCASLNGYLMDLEFYGDDMPLGGLEYAIAHIIGTLKAEGCAMFSLGGTYGCRLETSPHADPAVDAILDDLHRQGIFSDDGNLQFKNKFRPENRTIYLCRPVGSGSGDNVIDLIMMIADPAKAQTPETDNRNADAAQAGNVADVVPAAPTAAPAAATVNPAPVPRPATPVESTDFAACGYNPLNMPAGQVDYDLKTDSWAQLDHAGFIGKQMAHLHTQLQQPANIDDSLRAVFPFKYFVLTDSGRSADHLFCKAWPKKGIVVQNLLFPTCIYHQIDKGYTPHELPHPSVFVTDSGDPRQSELDLDALHAYVAAHAGRIAYVCIEVSDNAAGGHPVSLAHLRQLKDLLAPHAIALVIDGTRVLENAQFLIERDPSCKGRALFDVAAEILAYADAVIGSLAKDFSVNKGGLIATNDETLLRTLQDLMRREGGGLNVIEKKLVALSLQNRRQIEASVVRRMRAVETIWQALDSAQLPLVRPAGAHCILIDVKRLPQFAGFAHPVPSFLAWLFANTGIRGGAHSTGMQTHGPLSGQVRLAIPVGLKKEQAEDIAARLVQLFRDNRNIPELALPASSASAFGDVHERYELVRYHGAVDDAQEQVADSGPVLPALSLLSRPVQSGAPKAAPAESRVGDIAIVGMAGRYPKAASLAQFWDNLKEGVDCVGELPPERRARRLQNPFSTDYRGGFVDDVDKFDSLFFHISPREAEFLDPQERLFLEVAWETLEDAGYYPEIMSSEEGARQVGVFVGAVWAMYQMAGVEEKICGNNLNPNSFLWSIANRVSYWMNLTGPSLTVDTACSSSMSAIYLACEAIRNGDCSSAIVGGVNLDLHQHKFDINNAGGALSPDGVCRSFGAGANGYVAGEGVGAILIKPLAQAIADRDNIYGVIKSAVVNHGGRTSGYTVPNPKAQGELIAAALAKANVDPRSIAYIEAHGTGTELGDPIEIAGLTRAFAGHDVGRQSCPIGSVKTNIGHLEAAAGVVSVSKVLLQMKHRLLVPSLHSAELNELIDFKNSPFYVQRRLEAWKEKDVDGVKQALRAGLSSFGAGGANAHIVLEAYTAPERETAAVDGSLIFPLSARNDAQLREMAARLRTHLRRGDRQASLADVAFTLQNGRKSFEHRVAVVAASMDELIDKLGLFVDGTKDGDILSGHAKNADGVTKLLSRAEKELFVALLSQGRDPHKLAQLWIDGLLADCSGLPESGGKRTSLPTYPFADKRHWIGTGKAASAAPAAQVLPSLHPMIDSNESTFQRQLFKKTFHAREFFIRDHVVSGVPTLPGTAYLDLARMAGEIAAGRKVRKIRNVTWVSPLAVEGALPTEAFVELKPGADAVQFEVFGEAAGKKRLYAQGKLVYASDDHGTSLPERIDIDAIRARCGRPIMAKEAYPLFDAMGMHYGPSFQVLQEVVKNDDEVLGLLTIPEARSGDFDDFVLHPCVLDAAMQAGVMAQFGAAAGEMKVPYSIGEVELLFPLTRTCYSYLTKVKSERGAGANVARENVTIVDETGKVLARIRDSVGVSLSSVHDKPAPLAQGYEQLYYAHRWQAAPLAPVATDVQSLLLFDTDDCLRNACLARNIETVLVLPRERFEDLGNGSYGVNPRERNDVARLFEALERASFSADKICYAWPESAEPDAAQALGAALDRGVYGFLAACQGVIEQKPKGRVQLLYLHAGASAHNEAVNGFARSLRLENPKIDCKVLDIGAQGADAEQTLPVILAELHAGAQDDMTVRYDGGLRSIRVLGKLDVAAPSGASAIALKQNGVYLITGGVGGLGLIFAQFLAAECKARLVLTGRSTLSDEQEARLDTLRSLGAQVMYVAADVSDAAQAEHLIADTRARFGALNGIIHGAGVLRDSLLRKKTRDEMAAVFAPKVFGTFHLDNATRNDDLDFVVLFSSLAAVGGNAGQCDYAFANHYMDSVAARREQLRASGERRGRTVSINWSLWADGGMKLDAQTEEFFKKNLGIVPLRTQLGLDAFMNALSMAQPQLAVLEGVRDKIELAWGITKKAAPAPVAASVQPVQGDLAALVTGELSATVMDLLKISADDLSLDAILLDLGFDSIGLASFANAINERYLLDINPVMFFEYPSIRAIAEVLAGDYKDAVAKAHGKATLASVAAAAPAAAVPLGAINKGWEAPAAPPAAPAGLSRARRFAEQPIAIVGIGGVMPQSANMEAFWDNLKNGRNMVTDIPRDRWIWEDVDGNPFKETNKSNSKWGGFMKEVDKFDPLFFGITPREAEMMDPQQRIFIETVWSAIEDAGHKVSDLSGTRTGLFVGASAKDYIDVLAENKSPLDGYSASGNSHSILANRVSFLFNLRGPSAPLDTACSSSLIALHRAIESIHTGSSDMAIVGGVQVMLTPIGHISLSSAGMLSVDGKCKTFSKDANGYVRGEGSGAIFIKPLAQAELDGNPIYAVIKSTAENHGGRVTMLTAPNPKAQAELLVEAYEKAQIDPSTVGYIECHGTGTSLGDPIEIQALKKAFADLYKKHGKEAPRAPSCGLSSVKTNIGHLEPAAGIASLLKVLLSIRHRQIPALLHFEQLNPYIDLSGSPFYIVDKTTAWEAPVGPDGAPLPRRAGVSSFGWGGANAHVVLEEYIAPSRAPGQAGAQLVLLSAKSEERLKASAASLLAHIGKHEADLGDLAYTLQVGRDAMDHRLGMVVNSLAELVQRLRAFGAGATAGLHRGRVQRSKPEAARGDLDSVADAWVRGADVDWHALHPQGQRRRISLPSYPFARERYWIAAAGKTAPKPAPTVSVLHSPDVGSLLARPVWTSTAGAVVGKQVGVQLHRVLVCGLPQLDIGQLGADARRLPAQEAGGIAGHFGATASACFEQLQAILKTKPKGKVLFQVLVGNQGQDALLAGLAGMMKSARMESPSLVGQVILTDAADPRTAAGQLLVCRAQPDESLFRFEGSTQSVLRWQAQVNRGLAPQAFREGGVYLIAGGLGGLGLLFARDILAHAPSATVVLTGRAALTAEQRAMLADLPGAVAYRQLDLDRQESVTALVAEVVATYGALNGVIHSAGTTRDSLIVNKTPAQFAQVLAPKVGGTVHLDQASAAIALDFMVLFSSVTAVMGNVGQADYAAANGFMDQFAAYRNTLVDQQQRHGRTLSINWPLWEEGGMQVDARSRAMLLKMSGMLPMRTDTGMQAFQRSLALPVGQTLVMEGHVERLTTLLFPDQALEPAARRLPAGGSVTTIETDRLRELVLADLRRFQTSNKG
ncbi:SDR family NAD(P)-dependent oxidoreductase [Massilia atriviolacea]|uniref:SDR family NAD(P)-dependent oxidoreductase n=1 Tax=Massilia atriviolacea TaxID=2495579 RepID=A0A430HS83_9BURK|nr:SDR family NAD(P)-dependent oxidoreductase [Massilia atriviolacea]RSZ60405.1 SDR family NAD(P)-dependent oxidoreductase [Massilia atriviolacea]